MPRNTPERQWTRAEIEKAIADKELRGIPYTVTAERMGVSYGNLRGQVHRYRQGTYAWKRAEERERRLKIAESMIEQGAGITEIGRAFGGSKHTANSFLRYHGFDAEVRRLYRDGGRA